VRRVAFLAVALVAAGCGSTQARPGRATVWVTRDRGAHVLHVGKVPAGLSAMQAVARLGKVETKYGGRYLRSVDGVAEHGQRAWFYYVNGYLADRASTDYRLRAGDVLWWDYRSWRDPAQDPVVVGAFPEPFLDGYAGKARPGVVISAERVAGRKVAGSLHARLASTAPAGANVLYLDGPGRVQFRAVGSVSPGGPVRLRFTGDWRLLLRRPFPFRFRYSVP
jgi:Domain of unknown function (DUF4430)